MMRKAGFGFVALTAVLAILSGCNRTFTTIDPQQSVSVNPVIQPNGAVNLEIRYIVLNKDKAPVTFNFPSSKQFDIWIVCEGKELARESRGKSYSPGSTSFTLQPGESKEYTSNLTVENSDAYVGKKIEMHTQLVGQKLPPLVLSVMESADGKFTVIPESTK